jgi:hypothetical protein
MFVMGFSAFPSNNIDITVENMSSNLFAEKLTECAGLKSYMENSDANSDQTKRLSVTRVEALPDRSIDICNLPMLSDSSEAVAVSDAQRRDLTISNLAFKFTTGTIKVFVNDIADLKNHLKSRSYVMPFERPLRHFLCLSICPVIQIRD